MNCSPPQQPGSRSRHTLWDLDIDNNSFDDLANMRPPSVMFSSSFTRLGELSELAASSQPDETPLTHWRRHTTLANRLTPPPQMAPLNLTGPQHQPLPLLRPMPSLSASASASDSPSHNTVDQDSLSLTYFELDEEMPPLSPFFSRISESDIVEARETVRRASISRRNTLTQQTPIGLQQRLQQRTTWCASNQPPPIHPGPAASLTSWTNTPAHHPRMSLAGTLDRWATLSPTTFDWDSRPALAPEEPSRNYLSDATSIASLESSSSTEWLDNQQPPMSPIFDTYEYMPVAKTLVLSKTQRRRFCVDVYSLFTSPLGSRAAPRVVIRECAESGELLAPIDMPIDDADVRSALRRYPWLLALLRRQKEEQTRRGDRVSVGGVGGGSARQPTGLRLPSRRPLNRLCSPASATDCGRERPTLSFSVANARTLGSLSDRHVRAVDVDAMVEAYLPRVHALLHADGSQDTPSESGRTLSESSSATLVAKALGSEQPDPRLSASQSEDPLSSKQKQPAMPPLLTPASSTPSLVPAPLPPMLAPTISAPSMRSPTSGPPSSRSPGMRLPGMTLPTTRLEKPLPRLPQQQPAQQRLRASVSVLNLRSAFTESKPTHLTSKRSFIQPPGATRLSPTSVPAQQTRRSSELPAHKPVQPSSSASLLRRRSTIEPSMGISAQTPTARRIVSPRALTSPRGFTSLDSGSRALRSPSAGSRPSGFTSPASRMSLASDAPLDSPLASRSSSLASSQRTLVLPVTTRGRTLIGQSSNSLHLSPKTTSSSLANRPPPAKQSGSLLSVFERRRSSSSSNSTATAPAIKYSVEAPNHILQRASISANLGSSSSSNGGGFGRIKLPKTPSISAFNFFGNSGPKSAPMKKPSLSKELPALPPLPRRITAGRRPDIRSVFNA
ncbi:hypothetical protein GGI07_001741 [Coemansia sp. Benny D115]|nr:hypothetical protein GGI07_001741 [Coemansia sp. Benny D115]